MVWGEMASVLETTFYVGGCGQLKGRCSPFQNARGSHEYDIENTTSNILIETKKHKTLVGGMVSTARLKVAAYEVVGIRDYKVQSN